MRDVDVREEVADKRDAYIIRHAWKRGPATNGSRSILPEHDWNRFWNEIEGRAERVRRAQGHRHRRASVLDAERGEHAAGHPARVCPRAGARLALRAGVDRVPARRSASSVHAANRIKGRLDLAPEPRGGGARARAGRGAPTRMRLTSRVAESLFWMGRYAERRRGDHADFAHRPDAARAA